MKLIPYACVILSLGYMGYCHADAQVVDATPLDPQQIQAQAPVLSVDQRLSRLEQQLQNRQQFDLVGQINGLQQALQELRGQVDELDHKQKQLEQRLNDFYQDLNHRLDKPRSTYSAPKAAITSKPRVRQKPVAEIHEAQTSGSAASQPASDNFPIAEQANEGPQAAVASPLQEQNAYQTGYNALKSRSYPQAITALESYLQQFPNGKYASSAHYWLGELYLVQKQLDKAAGQFNTVVKQYPHDSKIADATLKLGMVYYNKGQYPQAKTLFTQVQKQYPGTAPARLAEARLQGMSNISH